MAEALKVNIHEIIASDRVGPPPLVIAVVVTPNASHIAGGVPGSTTKVEEYILLSALPRDVQMRARTAIQALLAGM